MKTLPKISNLKKLPVILIMTATFAFAGNARLLAEGKLIEFDTIRVETDIPGTDNYPVFYEGEWGVLTQPLTGHTDMLFTPVDSNNVERYTGITYGSGYSHIMMGDSGKIYLQGSTHGGTSVLLDGGNLKVVLPNNTIMSNFAVNKQTGGIAYENEYSFRYTPDGKAENSFSLPIPIINSKDYSSGLGNSKSEIYNNVLYVRMITTEGVKTITYDIATDTWNDSIPAISLVLASGGIVTGSVIGSSDMKFDADGTIYVTIKNTTNMGEGNVITDIKLVKYDKVIKTWINVMKPVRKQYKATDYVPPSLKIITTDSGEFTVVSKNAAKTTSDNVTIPGHMEILKQHINHAPTILDLPKVDTAFVGTPYLRKIQIKDENKYDTLTANVIGDISWKLNARILILSDTFSTVGQKVVVVTATDNLGSSASDTMALHILIPFTAKDCDGSYTEDTPFTLDASQFGVVNTMDSSMGLTVLAGDHYTFVENTVTPEANYNGALFINAKVSTAGSNYTVNVKANITGIAVNDVPKVADENDSTNEDTKYTGNINATDFEGDAMIFSIPVQPTNGIAEVKADGSYSYTPNLNFNGNDVFNIKVDDGNGGVATKKVTITVKSVNDAPVVANENISTDEDTKVTGNTKATDIDGDALTYSISLAASNGTAEVKADGSYSFTPNFNFNGTDTFKIQVSDSKGGIATKKFTLLVNPVNDAPMASDVSVEGNEDATINGNFSATDVDKGALSYAVLTQPLYGTVAISGSTFIYKPNKDYNGSDSFQYSTKDPSGASDTAMVTVTVTPVNDAPEFAKHTPDTAKVNIPYHWAVKATDVDGDVLTYSAKNLLEGLQIEKITGVVSGSTTKTGNYAVTFIVKDAMGLADTLEAKLVVENLVEIQLLTDKSLHPLQLYPNPVKGILYINIGNQKGLSNQKTSILIFSTDGKLVQTEILQNGNNNINVSKLFKGIYTVTIYKGENVLQSRFIKQ